MNIASRINGHNLGCRMKHKKKTFDAIAKALGEGVSFRSDKAIVAGGDSLSLLKGLPDKSVSLILTDPPYHSTKKRNIYGDTAFKEDQHYIDWMQEYAVEWKRVLKDNGAFYCFCASQMASALEIMFSKEFNVLSQIVWTKPNEPGFDGWKQKMKKEALRQWYAHSERIIFAEPACEGNLRRSNFGSFLKETRKIAGLSTYDLCGAVGAYGKVNHGGAVSNWEAGRNVPSREQYSKICTALMNTGAINSMPEYEDAIRPFIIDGSKEFTDVWTFPSVRPYEGKHPAEKPGSMLEHIIAASTYEGDIVLDCFAGSGSTAVAASKLNRRSISIEIEPNWVSEISRKLSPSLLSFDEVDMNNEKNRTVSLIRNKEQMDIFSEVA